MLSLVFLSIYLSSLFHHKYSLHMTLHKVPFISRKSRINVFGFNCPLMLLMRE